MEIKEYLSYLDDLTHKERSIFFYCLVLKLSIKETSARLKIKVEHVGKIFEKLQTQKELLLIKEELFEQFQ